MKKSTDSRLLRIWSNKIRERDHHCQWPNCQKNEVLHAHHIVGRQHRATRWYIPNGVALCPGHHNLSIPSAEKAPSVWMEYARKKWPTRCRELNRRVGIIAKDIDPKKVEAHLCGTAKDYL